VASIIGNDGYGATLRLYTIKASFLDSQDEVSDEAHHGMPAQLTQQQMMEMMATMQKFMASQQPA
jgi:hypothetical protein